MSEQVSKKRFEKHLRMGIRFVNGGFVLLNGDPLPQLEDGSVGELVIAPECILDATLRESLVSEKRIHLLFRGSIVMVGISQTMIENFDAEGLIPPDDIPIASPYFFVQVTLNDDLSLLVRGDQEARLSPCTCTITSLNKRAKSLNHAFTLVSQAFETKRISHAGNVFDRVYAPAKGDKWQTLDDLRIATLTRMQEEDIESPLFPIGQTSSHLMSE